MKRIRTTPAKGAKAGKVTGAKATVIRRNKALFKRELPGLLHQLNWWRRGVSKTLPMPQRQANLVFNGIVSHGLPFLKEARARQISKTHPVELGFGILEFPIVFNSPLFGMEAHLRFGSKNRRKAIFIETFMGKVDTKASPSKFMKEIIDIAKATGYKVVYLRKPKLSPNYEEYYDILIEMWQREMKRAGQNVQELEKAGRPTSFDLNEIQKEHQQRMERLYYSVAKAFKFDKKTKGNYMGLVL